MPGAPHGGDVIDALVDCHLRMRQCTRRAAELDSQPEPGPETTREVAAKIHRYFTVALPLHEEDEEGSLFPRLLERMPQLRQRLAAFRRDHEALNDGVAGIVAASLEVKSGPGDAAAVGRLASAARALEDVWQSHLSAEEGELFPAARQALSAEDRAAIRQEMDARRARLPR